MAYGVKPVDVGVNLGQVFLGKYRVDSIIGHGGMGVVAECTHLALNERVAIKMLRQDVLLDQDAVQRFVREAQAAVKLKSEYVARVSDVGTFENGVPYMVMEFLEGHDLGQLLEQRGVLPVAWASELILQTCEALAEAHSLGIVHRDVKPSNLFVTWRPDGSALVKVLDFGISKSPMGTDMQLTQTQSLLGTPAYMSPEQMRSARLVDSRTDIWSLGTVFYEILEGRRPFEAESFSEMCVKVAVDPPSPMVNAPPALQQVILRCLAKHPEQRYANMAELGHDLVPFVADGHQGHRLVERMTRMLRRGHVNSWDNESSNLRARPALGTDPRSSPWQGRSEPQASPWQGHSEPHASPLPATPPGAYTTNDPADAFAATAPSTILNAPIVRRRWPLVVAAFALLIGAGIALGFVLSGSSPDELDRKPAELAPSRAAVDPKPDVAPATEVKPSPSPTEAKPSAPDVSAATGSASEEGSNTTTTAAPVGSGASHPAMPSLKKAPIVGNTHRVTKPNPVKSEPKPEVKPEVVNPIGATTGSATTPPPPAAKCDPFSAMHGCDKKAN